MEEKREKASCPAEVTMLGASNSNNNIMRAAEIILRLVPMGLCLAALLIMIKNAESNDYGSVSYDDLGGFKYLTYSLFIFYFFNTTLISIELLLRVSLGFFIWSTNCV